MKQGKVWGETELLLKTPLIEIHRLHVMPNSFCSTHKHNYKVNAFYCILGSLTIVTEKNDYALIDETMISGGEFTTVKPGEFHHFRTGDAYCEALEIYYPESLGEDIVRKTVGGTR